MKAHKPALITLVRQEQQLRTPSAGPRGDPHALSYVQERIWFFEMLVPDSALYIEAMAYHLNGAIDAGVLRRNACPMRIQRRRST